MGIDILNGCRCTRRARVIHQHIDSAEHICSLGNHALALDAVGHITYTSFQAPVFGGGSLQGIGIDIADVYIVARSEERSRNMLANPRSTSRDENLPRHQDLPTFSASWTELRCTDNPDRTLLRWQGSAVPRYAALPACWGSAGRVIGAFCRGAVCLVNL